MSGCSLLMRSHCCIIGVCSGGLIGSSPPASMLNQTGRIFPGMTWITLILVAAVLVLGIAIWSIKRHKDPHLALKTDESLDTLMPSISGVSLGMAMRGNAVEIFENGAFFDALLEDILAAKRTVHFETYLWKAGRLGQRMADAFSRQARAGVKVRLV